MQLTTSYPQLNTPVFAPDKSKINGDFTHKDILSLDQFSVEDLHTLFGLADEMKQLALHHRPSSLLAGYVVSLLFFEPSSRTFASFASAVKRLGGRDHRDTEPRNSFIGQ